VPILLDIKLELCDRDRDNAVRWSLPHAPLGTDRNPRAASGFPGKNWIGRRGARQHVKKPQERPQNRI